MPLKGLIGLVTLEWNVLDSWENYTLHNWAPKIKLKEKPWINYLKPQKISINAYIQSLKLWKNEIRTLNVKNVWKDHGL